jgi:hypothetical protein
MSETIKYQFSPVPFTAVTVTDNFWSPRLETNRRVTVPYNFKKCEETGRIDNFVKAAGLMPGEHIGIFYDDSDVFKVIEGAAYTLSLQPDPALDKYLDDLIAKIAAAQEEDGYLYTPRTINPNHVLAEREGLTRWSNLRISHELYNVGHLYEAAVAHYRATGKRSLLEVALKNADLIDRVFGPDKKRDVPGHQEIEIGLVKLYHVTGEARYLKLANFFLDERGHAHGRELYSNHGHVGYMQDHKPVIEQAEAVGHAVRAGYMYCGMADVAALTGNAAYIAAIDHIWENVVSKKLYLTGGIGALHRGEAFGEDYELPNLTAYTETCAAIANAMWNQRMFLLHGEAKYLDVLERVIYNGFLSGVSFSGDLFFYSNPLASDGQFKFNRKESASRRPWFDCSCCPPNIARFIPSLLGYIYAYQDDRLYVNLFVGGQASVAMPGQTVVVRQETNYPWEGRVNIVVIPERAAEFTVYIRIPGWAQNQPVPSDLYQYLTESREKATLKVNGEALPLDISKGFARIRRSWQPGDAIELNLPMPVRRLLSHEKVTENSGRVALERGPMVYCAEWVDNGGRISNIILPDDAPLQAEHRSEMLNGVTVISGKAWGLYEDKPQEQEFLAIPYYAWSHRGQGEMAVWLPRGFEA